jgi:hypothetical protein
LHALELGFGAESFVVAQPQSAKAAENAMAVNVNLLMGCPPIDGPSLNPLVYADEFKFQICDADRRLENLQRDKLIRRFFLPHVAYI